MGQLVASGSVPKVVWPSMRARHPHATDAMRLPWIPIGWLFDIVTYINSLLAYTRALSHSTRESELSKALMDYKMMTVTMTTTTTTTERAKCRLGSALVWWWQFLPVCETFERVQANELARYMTTWDSVHRNKNKKPLHWAKMSAGCRDYQLVAGVRGRNQSAYPNPSKPQHKGRNERAKAIVELLGAREKDF